MKLGVIVVVPAVDDPMPVGGHGISVLRQESVEVGGRRLVREQASAQLPVQGAPGAARVGIDARAEGLYQILVRLLRDDVERDVPVVGVGELQVAPGKLHLPDRSRDVHLLAGDDLAPLPDHPGVLGLDGSELGAEYRAGRAADDTRARLGDGSVRSPGGLLVESHGPAHHDLVGRSLLPASRAHQEEDGGEPTDQLGDGSTVEISPFLLGHPPWSMRGAPS